MSKLPVSSPFSHKLVVGTLATFIGIYAFWKTGSDYQFIKFEPHSAEEVERRKRENIGLQMRQGEGRTLDYTEEAKAKLRRRIQQAKETREPEPSDK